MTENYKNMLEKGLEFQDFVTDILIKAICERIFLNNKIRLKVEISVNDKLAKDGFDPEYGARPLRRAIANLFEDELANVLLQANHPKGTVLRVMLDANNKIIFMPDGFEVVQTNKLEDIFVTPVFIFSGFCIVSRSNCEKISMCMSSC
jgi:hypothetical protein